MRRNNIVKTFDPPIRIQHNDFNMKAFARYTYMGSGYLQYYRIDIYERGGEPFEHKDGAWLVHNCSIIDIPITNKTAVRFLEQEE
jgi:hypothetical protein